jgi:hypothetical protein
LSTTGRELLGRRDVVLFAYPPAHRDKEVGLGDVHLAFAGLLIAKELAGDRAAQGGRRRMDHLR